MTKKVIATVGLSRGYTAFYDPKTHIILDLARPIAPVYEGYDVSNLKKALGNTIYLVSGSLSVQEEPAQKPLNIQVEQEQVIDEEVKIEHDNITTENINEEVEEQEKPALAESEGHKTTKKNNKKK